jgi:hypothetical protein
MTEREMEREISDSLFGVRDCAGNEQCSLAWAFEKDTSIHNSGNNQQDATL